MTGRPPLPFNGPSSVSKAALEAFADVYRGELKPFGVAFVMVQPGNMATGGPAKTAAALERAAESMTPEQRDLYGDRSARPIRLATLARFDTCFQDAAAITSAIEHILLTRGKRASRARLCLWASLGARTEPAARCISARGDISREFP
jgi:NAD(P)-dependent dehydrogenase (short-subunit alcohol dehydrogenase family)